MSASTTGHQKTSSTLYRYLIVGTDTLQRKSLKIKISQKGPSENTHSGGAGKAQLEAYSIHLYFTRKK